MKWIVRVRDTNQWQLVGKLSSRFWADRVADTISDKYKDVEVVADPDDCICWVVQIGDDYSWDYSFDTNDRAEEVALLESESPSNDGKEIRLLTIDLKENECIEERIYKRRKG